MADFDPTTADKDQLVKFAKDNHQVTIDPRTKIETIRVRVESLVSGKEEPVEVATAVPVTPTVRFVKSATNGNVYEWHEGLNGCDWLTPCDADGNIV
jgi:hypothetical protein